MSPVSMLIEVTAEDLLGGNPGQCTAGPISLAIRRAMPDLTAVDVGRRTIILMWGRRSTHWVECPTPDEVAEFLRCYAAERFDAMDEFTFELVFDPSIPFRYEMESTVDARPFSLSS